jgi:hypothetical protein
VVLSIRCAYDNSVIHRGIQRNTHTERENVRERERDRDTRVILSVSLFLSFQSLSLSLSPFPPPPFPQSHCADGLSANRTGGKAKGKAVDCVI